MLLTGLGAHLRDMCPSRGGRRSFREFVSLSDQQVALRVQEALCQAPSTWLDQAEEHFLSHLDFFRPIQVCGRGGSAQDAELCHFLSTQEADYFERKDTHRGAAKCQKVQEHLWFFLRKADKR